MSPLLLMAVAPALALMYFFWLKDKYEPEPRNKIVLVMFLGGLTVIPAVILEMLGDSIVRIADGGAPPLIALFMHTFVVIAIAEELGKFLVVRLTLYRDPEFDEPYDGIVYCVAASLGFALVENIFYVLGSEGGAGIAILRALLSVPAHALFGGDTRKAGEHYVTNNAKEYASMFFNALKGGFVIAFMVVVKFLTSALHLPILQDTLLKAFNYSFGFVGIHLWHGVVATKQPAMTASTIAQSIESTTTKGEIKELGNVIIKVFRSQFAAVMGNLLMVFPLTFLLTYGYYMLAGKPLMSIEDAHHKFELVNPLHSYALFHAAIAGVMLFLAGIFSGLADNDNMFNNYSGRLEQARLIQKLFGPQRAKKLATYVEDNLGSLTGNFSLGFLLAFVSFIGFITGLPLDIMHVTFATGNLGFATASIYHHITLKEALIAFAGIACIGLTNIVVSFTLTMIVAIKSRGINLDLIPGILAYVGRQFFRKPLNFFFPSGK